MTKYGIGLTTFRDKKSENFDSNAYIKAKKGKMFEAAKRVNKVVRDEINWESVTDYKGYPALGVYESGKEPAAHIYITTQGNINTHLVLALKHFRKITNQDSILLYKFVKTGGNPVLEINIGHGYDISKIQKDILKATDGKIGGYLTYIYSLNRIVIVNVSEFDELTKPQFRKLIPNVKTAVKSYNGKIIVKQATVKVI